MLDDRRGRGGGSRQRQRIPIGAVEHAVATGLRHLRSADLALLQQPLRVRTGDEEHALALALAELEGEAGLAEHHRAHVVERDLDLDTAAHVPGDALPDDDLPPRVDREDAAVEAVRLAVGEGQLDGAVAHRHPVAGRGERGLEEQHKRQGSHGRRTRRF